VKRLLLVTLAAAALVFPATAAEGAAPRCQGQRATIVGHRGLEIDGTQGRDVIVTNGAGVVRAKGGDDLVCVTSSSFTYIDDGEGDDVIDARALKSRARVAAHLGAGDDTYRGGWGHDRVTVRRGGLDRVLLGGNSDDLVVGSTSPDSTFSLGAGTDSVFVEHAGSVQHVDGGAGDDELLLSSRSKEVADRYVLDNRAGRLEADGRATVTWTSIDSFVIYLLKADTAPRLRTDFTFIGTSADETLLLWGRYLGTGRAARSFLDVDVDMAGGDDLVDFGGTVKGRVRTGRGRDGLSVGPVQSLRVDLPAGTVDLVRIQRAGTKHVDVSGVEDVSGWAYRAIEVAGDDRDNTVEIYSCTSFVHAGAGNDSIRADSEACEDGSAASPAHRLHGDDGDDLLIGSDLDDHLDGGPGTDVADGQGGTDLCLAETTSNCEGP
jgi:Ca2+-binding RTX toxin-like protein